MPKEVSTPKQSGGGGYTFADEVAASYLLKMLAGVPPLDSEVGQIESVRFEKRVDGWFLDDIVLFLHGLNKGAVALAISVKSDAQITEDGFPVDFTRTIWEQRLHVQTDKFDPSTDYLSLATCPLDIKTKSAWDGLLTKAIDADPTEFGNRIATARYDNEIGRKIYESLNCPSDIDPSSTATDTTFLLKRLRHFQFDFQCNPSDDVNDCVTRCGELLRDGGQAEGHSLWTHLTQISRSLATSGGDLTRTQLADRLRAKFSLNEFPNYVSDWRKLSDDLSVRLERIRGDLAGSLEISRDDVSVSHCEQQLTALLGSSGSGKTVLAKNIAASANAGHAVWLSAADLNLNDISEQFSALGIQHRFPELVSQSVSHSGLIVVDGFEHLNQAGLANLAILLRRARMGTDSTAWSFVFTCVADRWDSTFQALKREFEGDLDVEIKTVQFSFNDHRSTVLEAFPNMARMLQRPNLSPLFGNMKILDLVLSNANVETNTDAWVGESDILEWYWSHLVHSGTDGVARSRFIQSLSCIEADRFSTGVPIGEFDTDECQLIDKLQQDQMIWNHEERVGFEHDLIGDWARVRYLLSRQDELVTVVRDKALNPKWHRAIRIFGLSLLEKHVDGEKKWLELVSDLSPEGKGVVESDLVLEAVAFAANSEQLLQRVWDRLAENSGNLLNRLLMRFLHVATLPDPFYSGFSNDVAVSTLHRIPFWPLWLPVHRVLYKHRAISISLATEHVTRIADLWLKNSEDSWPLRNQAAEILLDATAFVIEKIREKDWQVDSDLCKRVLSRFLTAAVVRPDDVSELALSLVERRELSLFVDEESNDLPEQNESKEDIYEDIEGEHSPLFEPSGALADPWPDGPLRHVHYKVHDGFLSDSDPLQYLFAACPDAAIEVLLALLIREPLPTRSRSFHSPIDEFLHVDTERDWTPGMFFHGPFLVFLQINSEKGIEAIVKLINFVTQRWLDNRNKPPLSIRAVIDGEAIEYCGSSEAYYWYRDSSHSPSVVVPALMALEKWLYLCLEQEVSVKPAIQQVLKSSQSTALLGVLTAIGRKQPELFDDELRILVPCWQLQVWEEEYRIQQLDSLLGLTTMEWTRWGEAVFNMVRDWHEMDHRSRTLGNVLFELFVANLKFRSYMKGVHKEWIKELESLDDSDDTQYLEKITIQFDEDNWKARQIEDKMVLEFVEPEERAERLSPLRKENARHMAVLSFPITCRSLINEGRKMAPYEVDQFWEQLQRIASDAELSRSKGDSPEHAIMGGIAVLRVLHQSWIDAEPQRDNWCIEQFAKILASPPSHPAFHVADSVSDHYWNNFAAMIVPGMLAEDATDRGIRSLCAEFVLAFNYSVIQDFMTNAFACRSKLGDEFLRLQHLVLVSSGMRNVKEVVHGGNSIWGCPDVEFDIVARFEELIQQFVTDAGPTRLWDLVRSFRNLFRGRSRRLTELPKLVEVAEESTDNIFEMVRQQHKISYKEPANKAVQDSIAKRTKRGRGFEPFHLRAGFSWLENIEAAKSSAERMQWISTLENLIHGFLRPLGGLQEALADEEGDDTFFSSPGQWDSWIFSLAASVIPKLEGSESGYRLWKPILSFGLDRTHWVDAFISAWFINGLRVEGCEASFFREWKAMIAFAWSQDNWQQSEVKSHQSDGELFRHLMGFSSFGHGYYEDDKYRPYVATMKPEFEKWIGTYFPHPEATSVYANFLTYPSAVDHLRDGVRRLAETSSQFDDWHWRDFYYLENALMKLLEYDWSENSALILRDEQVRQHFSIVLKTMTDRQIPRAMELQDNIVRSN